MPHIDSKVASERFRVSLPAEPTPLIGRDGDLARLMSLQRDARLVTVVGPPGIGKTRLALALAHRDGGWFCDLSQVRDRAGFFSATAAGLGVPLAGDEVESIGHRLAALGSATVVMDNFEQLMPHAGDTLEPWLAAAPALRLVVTSRERLRLRHEQVFEIGPLGLPRDGGAGDAVALLLDRVRAARPEWTPTPTEDQQLAALACALEGIPLAIELAAARIDVLGVEGVLVRLGERLELLSRGARDADDRQATLRDAIAWSWQLLDPRQRSALARCAVFRGGFDVAAAEAVLGDRALDAVQDLRDRSLIRAPSPGRFSLYESIAAYAGEQLDASGERDEAERLHADHYLALGTRLADAFMLRGAPIDALIIERDNLVAIAERAWATQDGVTAKRAVLALDPILSTRGPASFHLALLERASAAGADARLLHARALARRALGERSAAESDLRAALALEPVGWLGAAIEKELGVIHHNSRQMDEAREHYRRALERARAIAGDEQAARRIEGIVVANLGALDHDGGHFEQAVAQYRQALDMVRAVGDERSEGLILANLGVLEQEEGRSAHARRHYERALGLLVAAKDYRLEAITLGNLGVLEHEAGALAAARSHHELALGLLHEVGHVRSEALSGARLGAVVAAMGDTTLAEAYFDEAERLVLERDPLALDVVRLHRCFLDVARGDHDDAARRLAAAQTPRSDGVSLVEINDDARIVLRMLARHFSDGARPRLAVGPDALWFEAPGVGRQSLEKYTAARRILECLVGARLERPGEGVSGEALFEAGWPGVSIAAQSANNRLYVALAKLRKVGLKVILLRQDDGYLLDPGTLVERCTQ